MRGRKPIPIYIYKNQEFFFKASSITEAAEKTGATQAQVRNILYHIGKQNCTRQGFAYSTKPLTDDEIEQLPCIDQKGYTKVDGKRCRQIVDEQEYEVSGADGNVTYQASKKQERIDNFKQFLFNNFRKRWMLIPKKQATLERTFIREFLDSI